MQGADAFAFQVQLNLNIDEERAKDIATHVAFSLIGGDESKGVTLAQFTEFLNKWVKDPKGNQEFMLHTVFSSQDRDENGFIDEAPPHITNRPCPCSYRPLLIPVS